MTLVGIELIAMGMGWVRLTKEVAIHPLASVTVTVVVPMFNPVAIAVVCPFDHKYE